MRRRERERVRKEKKKKKPDVVAHSCILHTSWKRQAKIPVFLELPFQWGTRQ